MMKLLFFLASNSLPFTVGVLISGANAAEIIDVVRQCRSGQPQL